jgi:hypothetical protein
MRMRQHTHWRDEQFLQNFGRKYEGRRPLARLVHRWEDNIRTDLRERGAGCELDSYGSGQGPVAGFCEHGNDPSVSIKGGEFRG